MSNLIRIIIRGLFNTLTRVRIQGIENVPQTGACLLAVNHLSMLEPPLVFGLIKREKITALVAKKYRRKLFFRWLIRAVDGIWINREETDFQALREALTFLKDGGALGIAPEGTRSHTGALIKAKTGVAYLADKAGVPVVPVAVSGTETAFAKLKRLKRPHIEIKFGKPFHLPPVQRSTRAEDLQRNTDEIMCQLAALLPPAYRGVYADHSRLKELLQAEPPLETVAL
ncbi:MAG: lysophospholipid acyltransferase family protein [Anaerolineales bacterium]|jgi:1-acyl-sn-glycerol-3-phosphate acyltransferase